jgi:superfamily II DNA or RNA helicase
MSDLLKLRQYQDEAVNSTFEAIALGTNRPAVVLPTGAGKTVIFSWIANRWVRERRSRVLILVHRDELVSQTVKKLHGVAPGLRVGVVKAQRNEYANVDVIVGSVQTLRAFNRRAPIVDIGLVIVDEAHHASAESYRTILDHFGCFTGQTPAVGFSATLVRSDGGDLGAVWDRVVCRRDILDLIPEFLCDVVGKLVTVDGLSLDDIRSQNGDLASGSLTDALLTADAQRFVVESYFEHARDRKTIVFTPTVLAMEAFAESFRTAGVRVGSVWGSMPAEERALTLKRFASGEIDVIVNCMVLTEGFDEPSASCAIIARPTRSAALYVQMVGRVLRKHPGKTTALVLDVVGASQDHKLATLADLTSKRIKEIREGETLAESAIREREEGNPSLANYVVTTADVDLFHRSPTVWLTTDAGVYFIRTQCQSIGACQTVTGDNRYTKCGNHLWFLWPDSEGTYKVGVRSTERAGGRYLREGLDLETAMSWAEQYATEEDKTLANRSSSWRRRAAKPTDVQVDYALTLGIEDPKQYTKTQLSDLMSTRIGTRVLDRAFRNRKETVPG